MITKVTITFGTILLLLIVGLFGVVILYDKQEAYCAKRSQEILGDKWGTFVSPTEKEIKEFKLHPPMYNPAKNTVNLGYLEFLECKEERNIFKLIQNEDIRNQKIN